MKKAIEFIEKARRDGYEIRGSALKVDFNGTKWNVGFWIRPCDWDSKTQEYRLPGLCGKAKHESLERAIELAIEETGK